MSETDLSPLDKLMLAVSASESPKNPSKSINDENLTLNEDQYFLAKIAANDLKVVNEPEKLKKIDTNIPSTSSTIIKSPSTTKTGKKSSLIHADDESNRNFEDVHLNDYGKEIQQLLPEIKTREEFLNKSNSWKPKRDLSSIKAIPPGRFGLPQVPQTLQSPKSDHIIKDPFFGIRISNPLISSALLEERMNGRAAVSMFRVKNFLAQNCQTQDWVIAGCIVQKSTARTSQSGNQYLIWTLSDLQNDLQTVSMFLFKNAFKELWKTTTGTVVGVLNPSVMDNREGSKHQAALSVDNHQRVMIFGQSKDYGVCKSRKKDGEPCTAFVNTNHCSYCLYHVKQEYQKCSLRSDCQSIGGGLTALRNKVLGKNEVFYAGKSYMALPAKKNRRLTEKDNKRLSDLMNKNYMTSGPIQPKKKAVASSLEVSRAQRFKDLQLLQKLNGSSDLLTGLEARKTCDLNDTSDKVTPEESRQTALDVIANLKSKISTENIPSTSKKANTSSFEVSRTQRSSKDLQKSSDLLTGLKARKTCDLNDTSVEVTPEESQQTVLDVITNLKSKISTENIPSTSKKANISSFEVARAQRSKDLLKSSDLLTGLKSGKTFDLNDTSVEITQEESRQTALDVIPNLKTKISTEIPSSSKTSSKLPIDNIDRSKLKLFKDLHSSPAPRLSQTAVIDLNSPIPNHAKQKALKWVEKNGPISKTNPKGGQKTGVKRFLENSMEPETKKSKLEERAQFSERFRKIMEMSSRHSDLLEDRDLEEQEKYFNKLEQREKMEEKMMTTYKVQCKAVKCLNCKYTSFSAAPKCKEEKHALKVFDAIKRFFKCGDCGNRTVSLDVYPTFSCKNCGKAKWERTTMMKEKIVNVSHGLSIRGGDQTFVNSVVSDANINLLIPDN